MYGSRQFPSLVLEVFRGITRRNEKALRLRSSIIGATLLTIIGGYGVVFEGWEAGACDVACQQMTGDGVTGRAANNAMFDFSPPPRLTPVVFQHTARQSKPADWLRGMLW